MTSSDDTPDEPNDRVTPIGPNPDRTIRGFPESTLEVTVWPDPVLDRLGHDPRSPYVERYWLSVLGPSCLLIVRRLAAELEVAPDGFAVDTRQWAAELGLGMRGGRNGPFWKALERACRFGAAKRNGPRLAVRRRLPPLTARQVERLPDGLRQSHDEWMAAQLERPRRPTISRWSDDRNGPGDDVVDPAARTPTPDAA